MSLLASYFIHVAPSLILLTVLFFLLPAKEKLLRIMVLIFAFILVRDAMTPAGIWTFGSSNRVLWFRFIEHTGILLSLALISIFFSLGIVIVYSRRIKHINWFGEGTPLQAVIVGAIGSLICTFPFIFPYLLVEMRDRGGAVPQTLWLPLLIFALSGNFLEETLFRGLLQTELLERTGPKLSILLSALFFAAGHIFLATTVTTSGPMLLIFTFWEGLICALLKPKYGIMASTIAHGLTLFWLSAGLF